jgi:hypothetical protein
MGVTTDTQRHQCKSKKLWTSQGEKFQSRTGPGMARTPKSPKPCVPAASVAMFTHSVRTQANTVKFGHQAMCNPKMSSLLKKALQKGFLKRCPNLSEDLVTKYLNPSPATAKGHMKRPKKGIRSTSEKAKTKGDNVPHVPVPIPQVRGCTGEFSRAKAKKVLVPRTQETRNQIRWPHHATSYFYPSLKIAKTIQHPLFLNQSL